MFYLLLIVLLFATMLIYFRIADRYNIIDKPNERSSHSRLTIRGGGVIFVLAMIFAGLMQPEYWMVVLGAATIGAISFLDDRITLSGKIRILFHLVAVTLLFVYLGVFGFYPQWFIPILYIVSIGIINAYNFMDGINGITGLYSIMVLGGLQFVNLQQTRFIEPDMVWLPILSCMVFLFFNFRKRAKCFAGDVGSVTMAFWIIFLLLKLIMQTGNYIYILFLAVYGVDSILTILHRLYLKQNIFEAHRLHFYQILVNERRFSHLLVSLGYALLQLVIIWLVICSNLSFLWLVVIVVSPLIVVYCVVKPRLMKITVN